MKKVISIFLALLFLGSNLGFSMDTHYCGGHAIKSVLSFGAHDYDCGMENTVSTCESQNTIKKMDCCDDEHQLIQLDDNLHSTSLNLDINPLFVVAFVQVFIQNALQIKEKAELIPDFSPPLPHQNRQVLYQSFLI